MPSAASPPDSGWQGQRSLRSRSIYQRRRGDETASIYYFDAASFTILYYFKASFVNLAISDDASDILGH
jgi:hypothetical protein